MYLAESGLIASDVLYTKFLIKSNLLSNFDVSASLTHLSVSVGDVFLMDIFDLYS